ncbi:Bromodomain transcription factor [Macleaya cordata]|uniref:Transcription initiation factor TFIID subunit 8 n=1 Tax=Macleaya cordata TaxID=56857 RepID=A0A200QVW9_MACCD|nr:Bromodomain transcription factor [Macleaya cordata]
MTDGGGESGKENEHDGKKKSGGGSDEFGLAIARIAVAQICENSGFQSFQQSALESLSDIAIRYLRELGKTAHFYANLAGRTDCNVFDIIQGLEDLGSAHGFSGASDINRCSTSSGTVREIIQFVNLTEEIPFARPVPQFPVTKNRKPTPSFGQISETPDGEHIPAWLPAFPDPHTYVNSPMSNERETDRMMAKNHKIEELRQHRKAEWSLLNLQQRLACNGSAATTSVDPGDAAKAKRAAESNPFLAPPLQSGEIDVSPVAVPAKISNEAVPGKNRASVLDIFAPAIEASTDGICESGHSARKILPSKRPIVNFKLGFAKKSLGMPLDLTVQNQGVGTTASWFGRDDEMDEKKRRAEQILKESMENPQKLA